MADDSTSYEIDIDVNAKSLPDAASAVDRLRDRMEAAGVATSKAAEAVKVADAAYRQAEATANRAASALEKVSLAVDGQAAKLKKLTDAGDTAGAERAAAKLAELKNRQAELTTKASEAKAAMLAEAASLDKLKAAAQGAVDGEKKLSEAHEKAKNNLLAVQKAKDAATGSGKVNEMAEAFGKLGGPLGQAGAKAFGAADGIKKLLGSLGTGAGPYIAIAIAIAAIATAAVTATAAVLSFALANSNAARMSRLQADAIEGSAAAGAALSEHIDSLANKLPLSTDEIRSMASELAKSGLRGTALADALDDAAAKAAKAKLGPNFLQGMLTLDKQSEILQRNMSKIFTLNDTGLMSGLASIVALFDKTSVTGKAIQAVFQSLFQPLMDGLAALAPKVVSTFITFEIWVLKALLALKSIGPQLAALGKAFLAVGAVIVAAVAVVVGVFLAIWAVSAAVGIALWYLVGTFIELAVQAQMFAAKLMAGPGGAFDWLKEKVTSVIDWLSGLSLAEIGASMVEGLVRGITGGAASVVGAVQGLASGAVEAATSLLQINSPSKVFAHIGESTGEGMALGVDNSAGDVQSSMQAMVASPDVPSGVGSAGGGKGAGNVLHLTVNAPSAETQDIVRTVRAELEDFFGGAVTVLGGEVPA